MGVCSVCLVCLLSLFSFPDCLLFGSVVLRLMFVVLIMFACLSCVVCGGFAGCVCLLCGFDCLFWCELWFVALLFVV